MSASKPLSRAIWVLADDRAGNRAQAIGLMDRLGLPYTLKEIRYDGWVRLPNLLRGKSLLGVAPDSQSRITAPWPDMVISAGRRTAPIARFIKRQHPACKLVQLMWPDAGAKEFDLIILPSHDHRPLATNVQHVLGAPHSITPEVLEEAALQWMMTFKTHSKPHIGVLVGGSNKHALFKRKDFELLGMRLRALANSTGGTLFVSTSRRTGDAGVSALKEALNGLGNQLYFYAWRAEDAPAANPYRGILGSADLLVVTGDSVAMTSEACATGKPVVVFTASEFSPKHARFLDDMVQEQHIVVPPTGAPFPLPLQLSAPKRLDPTSDLLPKLRALLG